MAATIDISQFFDVFFEESEELLAEMENLLLAINVASPDKEECNAIFRTAHSIKGGAATFGLTDMVGLTHLMESLLDKIRKGEMRLTERHVGAFLKAKDILKSQLNGHRKKEPIGSGVGEEVLALLRDLSSSKDGTPLDLPTSDNPASDGPPLGIGIHSFRIELPALSTEDFNALAAELRLKGNLTCDSLPDGRSVCRLTTSVGLPEVSSICAFLLNPNDFQIAPTDAGSAVADIGKNQACSLGQGLGNESKEEAYGLFEPLNCQVAESLSPALPTQGHGVSAVRPASLALKTSDEPTAKSRPPEALVGNPDSKYIRVNLDRVDQLINLVGELVITQAMIEQHTGRLDTIHHEPLLSHFATLARNTRDLQESVMSIRMMPMDLVFSRFPRMVRELAGKLGKKAKLVTVGGATELDKGLIERIIDPLTHLVRNSIDHGLEEPQVRLAAKKRETGTITLSAAHESGNIVLQVSDDGVGLNRARIIKQAKDLGVMVADEISDAELWQVIFSPGFTTASDVTDVSGRGVGMDIVKRNIVAMGGHVEIQSTQGRGTTVTIFLPLTLAILEGMLVKVGGEVYILPLLTVVESLKPESEQIRHITGKGRVISVREEYIPLLVLRELFGIVPQSANPADGIVVIVEALGKKAALLADSLVGQQQIVVKNLETNYRKIPGISGATILGDGNVSLILDVPTLLDTPSLTLQRQVFFNFATR